MITAELQQLRAAAPPVRISPSFRNADAPWPRVAYANRGGAVLHCSAACGSLDTTKCVTFQYADHRSLDAHTKDDGLMLCHTCRTAPGF